MADKGYRGFSTVQLNLQNRKLDSFVESYGQERLSAFKEDEYIQANDLLNDVYTWNGKAKTSDEYLAEQEAEKINAYAEFVRGKIYTGWSYDNQPYPAFKKGRITIGCQNEKRGWMVDRGSGFAGRGFKDPEKAFALVKNAWLGQDQRRDLSAAAVTVLLADPTPKGRLYLAQKGEALDLLVSDSDEDVRRVVIFQAGKTGQSDLLHQIANDDPSPDLRNVASRTIEKIEGYGIEPHELGRSSEMRKVCRMELQTQKSEDIGIFDMAANACEAIGETGESLSEPPETREDFGL